MKKKAKKTKAPHLPPESLPDPDEIIKKLRLPNLVRASKLDCVGSTYSKISFETFGK